MTNKKVSIIVPVFNVEKYVERCINSLINQNYDNIEIILVDDGSTDNSGNICDKYSEMYNDVKCYHIDNSGVSYARNYALKLINGEYFTFVDADDYISKDFVSTMMNYQLKGDYDITICNAINFNDKGVLADDNIIKSDKKLTKSEALYHFFKNDLFSCVCWGRIYKKNILKDVYFDTKMKIGEDVKFFLEAIENSQKIYYVNKKMYYYYLRLGSAVHSKFSMSYLDELDFWESQIIKFKDNHELCNLARIKAINQILRCLTIEGVDKNNITVLKEKLNTIYNETQNKDIKLICKKNIISRNTLRKIYMYIRRKYV